MESPKSPKPRPWNRPHTSPTKICARLYRNTWRPSRGSTVASLKPGNVCATRSTSPGADLPDASIIATTLPPQWRFSPTPISRSRRARSCSRGNVRGHPRRARSPGPSISASRPGSRHPRSASSARRNPPATCSYSMPWVARWSGLHRRASSSSSSGGSPVRILGSSSATGRPLLRRYLAVTPNWWYVFFTFFTAAMASWSGQKQKLMASTARR